MLKARAREKRPGLRVTLFANRLEWLMLACNSGLRPGEQAMLEFSDVDLVHGFIHVQAKPDLEFHSKNYQDRYIPLAPEARIAIESMLAVRKPGEKADLIFHRPDGLPWGDLADSMDRLFVDAGLNKKGTKRFGGGCEILANPSESWWRRGDSNARPRDYETLALAS